MSAPNSEQRKRIIEDIMQGHASGRETLGTSIRRLRLEVTGFDQSTLHDQADWPQLLRHAAEQLQRVPDKGVGYLPLRANPDFRPQLPLPAVALNYLGVYQSGTDAWQALPSPLAGRARRTTHRRS